MNTTATLTALVVDPQKPARHPHAHGRGLPRLHRHDHGGERPEQQALPGARRHRQVPAAARHGARDDGAAARHGRRPIAARRSSTTRRSSTASTPRQARGLFFAPSPTSACSRPSTRHPVQPRLQPRRHREPDLHHRRRDAPRRSSASCTGRCCRPTSSPRGPTARATQVPNANPELQGIGLFRHRVDGIPTDELRRRRRADALDRHRRALRAADLRRHGRRALPAARARTPRRALIETQCRKELLTFQFFATAGTFSPRRAHERAVAPADAARQRPHPHRQPVPAAEGRRRARRRQRHDLGRRARRARGRRRG